MKDFNNRIIEKRGRPKGKKFYPVTITLTQEQINYLQRQPNASELIRRILDDIIVSESVSQDKSCVISLNLQMKAVQERLEKLKAEREQFFEDNLRCWKPQFGSNGLRVRSPEPYDEEEAQVAFKVLKGYDEAINSMQWQIAEIKEKIVYNEKIPKS